MAKDVRYGTIIFAILIVLIVGLSVVVTLDSYTSRKRKGIYAVIIALNFILVMQNLIEYYLTWHVKAVGLRTFFSVLGYSVRPAMIVAFAYLFIPERKHVIAWVLVAVNALLYSTTFFSQIVFTINENNIYIKGPLSHLCYYISGGLLVYLAALGFLSYRGKKFDKKEMVFHLFWIGLTVLGMVADMIWGSDKQWVNFVTISVLVASVFSYIWLHQKFVADYEAAFLAEQRFNMMLTQMQPHFIYNSLSAIAEIDGVPENAQKAIMDFSDYLRENLDAMTTSELVPFEKELEHIKKYIDLEILRFGKKVNVTYDLQTTDFMLPALTVQMLVENAVKHGVTKRYEGGTVTISAKRRGGMVYVTVKDDGVGFDAKKEIETGHLGINNIKKRLEYTLGGTLEIQSVERVGTTATLSIPYKSKGDNL